LLIYSLIPFPLFLSDLIEKLDGRSWANLLTDTAVGAIGWFGDLWVVFHDFNCLSGAILRTQAAAVAQLGMYYGQGKGFFHRVPLGFHPKEYHPW
jgi:hypothetical protein